MATPDLSTAIEDLKAELTRDASVNSSASTLITALLAQVEANADAPDAVRAIVTQFRAQNDALAAAVAAGTPVDPNPTT